MQWQSQKVDYYLAGLVLLLGVVVYANSFPGAFILDDVPIVVKNPLVYSLDLRAIFTSDYWGVGADRGLYRPLTILTLALNRWLLGPDPWAYHLFNVLLHALVSLLFFQLLRCWKISVWHSFAAAALFAVHPIHTEVLNEVIGRSELLAALFFLLALRLAHAERPYRWWLAGFVYLLALLSKEHAVTFLAVLLVVDLFQQRGCKRRLPLYGGLLLLTALWLLFHAYGVDRGTMGRPPFYSIYSPLAFMPTDWRILTACKIQLLYLAKLCWPIGLQGVYSGPEIDLPVRGLFSFWGGAIGLTVLLACGLTVIGWRRKRLFGLAILLYVISFSVTANIVFATEVALAERFAYLPSLWFCLGVTGVFSGCSWGKGGQKALPFGIGLIVLLGMAGGATWLRNYDYRDGVSLFSVDIERDPRNVLAGMFLGDAYIQREEYAKAEALYRKILAERDGPLEIFEDMAWVLLRQKRPQEAVEYGLRAVNARPEEMSDKILMILAEGYTMLDQPQEVMRWLDLMPPGDPPGFFWELRGKAYEQLGELQSAVDCYGRVGEPPLTSDVPERLERVLRRLGADTDAEKVRQWREERAKAQATEAR
ncbi:MAG: tetratricopeptide repeat protein [Desulfobulbaceae bacterium]|nr:tetratricopeptide repeat protein [Desulfobulbaceae bacterium]